VSFTNEEYAWRNIGITYVKKLWSMKVEWPLVTWCSHKLACKPAISSKVTMKSLELVYNSSLSEWSHAFRNINSFFRVRPNIDEPTWPNDVQWWSRSVFCLAVCVENHLATAKSTSTTLRLPLPFSCYEWSHATNFCAKYTWTDRLPVWVLKANGTFPHPFYLPGRWTAFNLVLHHSSSVLDREYAYHKGMYPKLVITLHTY
jgi:hypothetical protein